MKTPEEIRGSIERYRELREPNLSIKDRSDINNLRSIQEFLNHFRKTQEVNLALKKWFFGIVVFMMLSVIIGSTVVLIIFAGKETQNAGSISAVIGASSGALSAIIALPMVIARHLFPTKEHTQIIAVVGLMMEYINKEK